MIDYAKLASKFGGVAVPVQETDYASLAAKFGGEVVDPSEPPSSASRFVKRAASNVADLASGLGSAALDAAKSSLSLEGQISYLPKLAKGMYEGAVQYGADAIARQLPNGAESVNPGQALRAGVAAIPVVGGYAMNRATDIEEGKGPEVAADLVTDIGSMMIPGTAPGRAGAAAVAQGAGRAALATAKGAGKVAAKVGPEVAGTVAGAVLSGGLGGVAGGVLAHQVKGAVIDWVKKRYGVGAKHAEQIAGTLKPAQIEQIVKETIPAAQIPPQAMIPEGAMRPSPTTSSTGQIIAPIPPNKLPPVLPDPVVPELAVAKSANGDLWNVRTGKRIEMTPAEAKAAVAEQPWNQAKAKTLEAMKPKVTLQPALIERIEKAVSPDAAWKELRKHGAGDGKPIPSKDARMMVDAVWSAKDPSYLSIEQWMAERAERWNSMRTKSAKLN